MDIASFVVVASEEIAFISHISWSLNLCSEVRSRFPLVFGDILFVSGSAAEALRPEQCALLLSIYIL